MDGEYVEPRRERRRIETPRMDFTGGLSEFVRDSIRIAAAPQTRADRCALWGAYVRACVTAATRQGSGEMEMLGYRVRYFEPANLLRLYREIFVRRLYDVPLECSSPLILDCGSNIGLSILFLKYLYCNATVIGFEPHPTVFTALRENIERNRLENVVVHQEALSDYEGSAPFFAHPGEPGALDMSLYPGSQGTDPIRVHVTMLSTYVDRDVDLVKLDVEGSEESILRDLNRCGKLPRIRNIVCEYHHHRGHTGDRLSRVLALLEDAGFGYSLEAYRVGPRRQQDVLIRAYRPQTMALPAGFRG